MTETIQVLIVDDHAVVRGGLRALVDTEEDMAVAGEAADGELAVEMARTLRPDVILMDMVLPRKDGIQAICEIKSDNPDARILVLTSFGEDEKVFPAIQCGALGYLLKDSSPEELLQAIRNVFQGESSLHPTIARKLIQQLREPPDVPSAVEPLTEREVEVLKLLAKGLSNHDIADAMVVSERTVGKHTSNILEKLHLANRTQAALYALREGLANLDST